MAGGASPFFVAASTRIEKDGSVIWDFGVPTDEYADSVMAQLAEGRSEVTYQFSAQASQASRADVDAIFAKMNS